MVLHSTNRQLHKTDVCYLRATILVLVEAPCYVAGQNLPENIHKKVRIRAAEMDESISASMEDINKLRTVAYGTGLEIGKLRSAMKSTAFIEGLTSIALR